MYADIARGMFLVRGENVLLLGEIVRGKVSKAVKLTTIRIWTRTTTSQTISSKSPSRWRSGYSERKMKNEMQRAKREGRNCTGLDLSLSMLGKCSCELESRNVSMISQAREEFEWVIIYMLNPGVIILWRNIVSC